MAKATGPDFVALQMRNLDISRKFYEESVGLDVDPLKRLNAVVFRTDPMPFAIREPLVDLEAVERLGWGIALWFKCDDSQELYESLASRDVRIGQEPFDGPFGRTFSFVDPDGYTVTVHDG